MKESLYSWWRCSAPSWRCWLLGWVGGCITQALCRVLEPAGCQAPDDPLRGYISVAYDVLKNKYWVDELYWSVILNPYIQLSRFLADIIDWRFWHDWFHDRCLWQGITP